MKRKIKRSMKRRLFNSTLATLLALTTVPLNIFPHHAKAATGTVESSVKLRFLETTDLHDNIMDYDYFKDAPTIDYGLDRTAQLIKQARADKMDPSNPDSQDYQQNSMLFDAGDLLQGNPMADYIAKVKGLTANEVHPVFQAMSLLHYDAGIPGNHEFNYGLDYLNTALQHVPYDFVNANIYKDDHDSDPTNDQNYFTPYKIINKVVKDENGVNQTIKVGVIGFAPPQIMNWDKDNLEGKVITKDIVKTAEEFIPKMKAAGADIIVAIAHSGCDVAEADQDKAENAVYSLTKVPGIDALLFGHAHVNFPGDAQFNNNSTIDNVNGHINNVPAMEAGFWGNNLGVMDLDLQKVDGKWTVASSKAALRPLTKTVDGQKVSTVDGPDQEIVDAVKDAHEGTLAYVRGKIGTTSAPLYSYFAQVQDDPTIQIVNNAQTAYVKKWIEDKEPELKDIPVLSAGAPFKAGGRSGPDYYTNIAAGDLSIKSANDLYLYPNTLKAVEVTGATVREWLEMAAGQFNTVDPNNSHPQNIINDTFPSYNFDVIDGVKYQVDITQKPRYDKNGVLINADSHRIVDLTMPDGTPVQDDQQFIVATNNYRAGGGGNFPGINGHEKVVVDSPDESRQVLMNYIQNQGTVNPSADGNWSIKPGDNVQMTFKSSPDAKTYADQSSTVKYLGKVTDNGQTWGNYELGKDIHVHLLGINDFHGQLDYSTKVNGKPVGGIQYLAGYLKERKALDPDNTLLVQAGDMVGASRPVSALLQDEPTIRFLNELGFNIGTIGNHEFDEGVTEMKRLIFGGPHPKTVDKYGPFEGANFPYIAANVVDEKTGEPILDPYKVLTVNGVKIGFIGVVTTETPSIVIPSGTAGVIFTDETEAINKYAKVLEDQGVKAIVVLAHDPGTSNTDGSNPTGKVVDIAKAVDPEVDVIFGAHDHKYLNSYVKDNTGKEKLLVQSYSYGTAFSDVDLTIDPDTQDIVFKKAEIVSTFQDEAHRDATIEAELNKYQADIAPITQQVVGQAAGPITRTANPAGETALGNLIADGIRTETGAQFAFMNIGGIRDDIKQAGDIKWGDLFAIQPFGNDIVTEKITGDEVRTLLNQQWSSTSYAKIMQISGLKYTWSDNLPIGQKVLDIYLPNGSKIDPNAVYTVAVNNFMADGGDGFTILKSGTDRVTINNDLDTLIDNVKKQTAPISAQIEGRIMLDTDVIGAVNDVTDQSPAVTGTTESGATIAVKAENAPLGSGTAKDDGSFSVDIPVQKAGTKLTVTITDRATNTKDFTVIVKDVTPAAPKLNPVTNTDRKITGTAEPGLHVIITDGKDFKVNLVADKNGNFTAFLLKPFRAYTVLYVFSIDSSFNVSPLNTYTVKDVTKPLKPTVNPVRDYDKKVTGKAEIGAKITVKAGSKVLGTGIVNKSGDFSVTMKTAQKAGTVLSVIAVDKAGNISAATYVTVIDKTSPSAPKVDKVAAKSTKVTGKAETGATVIIKAGTKVIGHAIDKDGKYSVTIVKQKAGTVLYVTAQDKAGNVSKATKVIVSK